MNEVWLVGVATVFCLAVLVHSQLLDRREKAHELRMHREERTDDELERYHEAEHGTTTDDADDADDESETLAVTSVLDRGICDMCDEVATVETVDVMLPDGDFEPVEVCHNPRCRRKVQDHDERGAVLWGADD